MARTGIARAVVARTAFGHFRRLSSKVVAVLPGLQQSRLIPEQRRRLVLIIPVIAKPSFFSIPHYVIHFFRRSVRRHQEIGKLGLNVSNADF